MRSLGHDLAATLRTPNQPLQRRAASGRRWAALGMNFHIETA
jgi:hypothetical protein